MTPSTTACSPGTVVLVRFPFTTLEAHKKRPAVVVSPTAYAERHGDIVIVPLTSVDQQDDGLRLEKWEDAGLMKPSWVKPLIATVSVGIVERVLGCLHKGDRECVGSAIRQMLGCL